MDDWEKACAACQEGEDALARAHDWAAAYSKSGKEDAYDRALPLLEKVYEAKEKWLGQENPSTLLTSHFLGKTYVKRGKGKESRGKWEKVLWIFALLLRPCRKCRSMVKLVHYFS